MRCKICQKEFIPNKYHPQQQVCFQAECQRLRQTLNSRDWRRKNPDYFKINGQEPVWQEKRRQYVKQWKIAHQDYSKEYQIAHQKERREYMREYMHKYRQRKTVNRDKI